jgi:hypothetical protein
MLFLFLKQEFLEKHADSMDTVEFLWRYARALYDAADKTVINHPQHQRVLDFPRMGNPTDTPQRFFLP